MGVRKTCASLRRESCVKNNGLMIQQISGYPYASLCDKLFV